MSAWIVTVLLYFLVENNDFVSASLSYRSDGPNVEYKSMRRLEVTPYVLGDGSWYRDMLTIEASRAVGQFAQKFHELPYDNHFGRYNQISPRYLEDSFPTAAHQRVHSAVYPQKTILHSGGFKPIFKSRPPSHQVKKYHQPIYDNALDYSDLRFIHIPKDLQVQRAIADKENSELMRVAKMKEGIFKPSMPDPIPSMLPSKASAPTGVIKKMFNKHIYSKPTRRRQGPKYPYFHRSRPASSNAPTPRRRNFVSDFFSTPRKAPLRANYYYQQ